MVPAGNTAWIVWLVPVLIIAILCMALLGRRKGRIRPPAELPNAAEQRAEVRETAPDAPEETGETDGIAEKSASTYDDEEDEAPDWTAERGAQAWRELGWELQETGRDEDAARAFRCALDALEEDQADSAWELHQELGALYIHRQQLREAQQHAVAACACAEMAFGSPSPQQAESLNALGALLEQLGNWNQARTQYQAALDVAQAIYAEVSEEVAALYSAIARMSERLMDRPNALRHYVLAYFIFAELVGNSGSDAESAKEDVKRAYRAEDRDPELFEKWLNDWRPA